MRWQSSPWARAFLTLSGLASTDSLENKRVGSYNGTAAAPREVTHGG